ncbi:protein of unknown function [Ekhidna lutea]|uniref:DUF4905 domain-containing protein n=1 Tax=Ekhidna lutea TaxID=447679 RepID=A0A239M5X2_EKHLU|nr:DUF4905 domain-containing protein [Ekhidna lutea]SNT37870.1 protein of unknown function [Ekhidna lutea]
MIPDSVNQIKLEGVVWGTVLDEESKILYLDVRDVKNRTIQLVQIDLNELKAATQSVSNSWWSQMMDVYEQEIYFVKYEDQNDPANQSYFKMQWGDDTLSKVDAIPEKTPAIWPPNVYEQGTAYHKTVASFLALELPLSCEYLEWDDKIIISYYLRSGGGYDRYLLLLEGEEKKWKLKQDTAMKGFSPGAFFVFQDQLIFIKNRNEVCVYTG